MKKVSPLLASILTLILSLLYLVFKNYFSATGLLILIYTIVPVLIVDAAEKDLIFPNSTVESSEFVDGSKVISGIKNYYVKTDEKENVTLGTWHVLPEKLARIAENAEDYDYENALANSEYDVLIFFQGSGGLRHSGVRINFYRVLRKTFHIIVFDNRGYADSTKVPMKEESYVKDSIKIYKWVRQQTSKKIYFWGLSLGSMVSIETTARLKQEGIVPSGLMLEATTTTIIDALATFSAARYFSWVPGFLSILLSELHARDIFFESGKHIQNVDCPIMILHAEDDTVFPVESAIKFADIAIEKRDLEKQGNVTLHIFPRAYHYGHQYLSLVPELPKYIANFISVCEHYNKGRG